MNTPTNWYLVRIHFKTVIHCIRRISLHFVTSCVSATVSFDFHFWIRIQRREESRSLYLILIDPLNSINRISNFRSIPLPLETYMFSRNLRSGQWWTLKTVIAISPCFLFYVVMPGVWSACNRLLGISDIFHCASENNSHHPDLSVIYGGFTRQHAVVRMIRLKSVSKSVVMPSRNRFRDPRS